LIRGKIAVRKVAERKMGGGRITDGAFFSILHTFYPAFMSRAELLIEGYIVGWA
jgi:hypothetical protein